MRVGVADYGLNVWDGALYDTEERLRTLASLGYEGTERLEAAGSEEALSKAALYRRLGMGFATVRGPSAETTIRWSAAMGCAYVWALGGARDLEGFCRQVRRQCEACAPLGLRVAVHNHLGTPVESQEQTEEMLERCPDALLVFDTAHLAAAGGDAVALAQRHAARVAAVHVKDWLTTDPQAPLSEWTRRGRFCELGAGNAGLDNAAVLAALREQGWDGWVFVEQDTHLRSPHLDLTVSRDYLRRAGI